MHSVVINLLASKKGSRSTILTEELQSLFDVKAVNELVDITGEPVFPYQIDFGGELQKASSREEIVEAMVTTPTLIRSIKNSAFKSTLALSWTVPDKKNKRDIQVYALIKKFTEKELIAAFTELNNQQMFKALAQLGQKEQSQDAIKIVLTYHKPTAKWLVESKQ
ncbi:hypothetical protein KA517_01925 [Candidatus Gracilibacteria bacterium]|nr:hypothetical protein [Candidatus Gracilibacteria bacterium]